MDGGTGGTMSDYTIEIENQSSLPAWVSRLRPGSFISPSGVESFFLFDDLHRSRGKKAATHEIADSDDSVLQDLGAGTKTYPMDMYFVGENYDQDADKFFNSLFEHYSPDAPGRLKHPRWGDIPVMPFSVEQNESFSKDSGISRITVEFRETKSDTFQKSSALSEAQIKNVSDEMETEALTAAEKINGEVADPEETDSFVIEDANSYTNFISSIKEKIKAISDSIDSISDEIVEYQENVDDIKNTLNDAIDVLSAPSLILAQVGALVKSVASIPADTVQKISAYYEMCTNVIGSYLMDIADLVLSKDQRIAAGSLQTVGAICVSALAESALATEFTTREQVGESIDKLNDAYDAYLAALIAASDALPDGIVKSFVPDHNVGSYLDEIVKLTTLVLLDRAFSLKIKRTIILSAPSDPITLTWKYYKDMDKLSYFCDTNKIVNDEFFELPAGRAVDIYA